jgi:hypothetical protein
MELARASCISIGHGSFPNNVRPPTDLADRRRSSRLMGPNTPRFWPEMKTRRGFSGLPPLEAALWSEL